MAKQITQSERSKVRIEKFDKRSEFLYKQCNKTLREIVRRNYRVVDLKGVDKHTLVSMILEAEFGKGGL